MPVPYFPFTGEPYQPTMGLKPLDLAQWLEPDLHQAAQLRLKADLLVREHALVLRASPESEVACRELYATLAAHLPVHHPDLYTADSTSLTVRALDRAFPLTPPPEADARELLSTVARWVQEDLCVLAPAAPVTITAGAVCFPSRWNLPEKFGQASPAIHAPVPKFAGTIGPATHSFLERLTVEKPVWRLNWTLHDSDHLFAPHAVPGRDDLTPAKVLTHVFLRTERQTLRRLPVSKAVVFTIRTHLHPLLEALPTPDATRLLLHTLEHLPAEVAAYKGMAKFIAPLKTALAARFA
jgi:hypothetical protein